MKRLLLPLLAALALPTAVEANWFGDKTFYLECRFNEYKTFSEEERKYSDWIPIPDSYYSDFEDSDYYVRFTLNEKDKTAYKYNSVSKDSETLDVLIFNRDVIKVNELSSNDYYSISTTQTINRINGQFLQVVKAEFMGKVAPTESLRGTCKKVKLEDNLF